MKSYKSNSCFILIFLLFIPFVLKAQEDAVNTFITGLIKDQKTAGAAIAVKKNGLWVFNKTFGFADLQNKVSVKEDTRFNIMSITKNFIAVAIIQLANQKRLDLYAPITQYLKDLPLQYGKIRINNLLDHTSGVHDYVHVKNYMEQANQTQTPMEILKPILNDSFEFTPGEKNNYSNSGYFLLGLIIEKISGLRLSEYLKINIFDPAGMKNTFLEESISENTLKAKGYFNTNNSLKEIAPLNPSQYWAAGGIVSTLNDMINWDEALQKGTIIPSVDVNNMMHPTKLNNGTVGEYGLGFEILNMPDISIAGCNGVGIGYNTSYLNFVKDGITVIVLANTTNSNSTMIAKNVHDLFQNNGIEKSSVEHSESIMDKLDSLVVRVINEAKSSKISEQYFENAEAFKEFKEKTMSYIQTLGNYININNMGEKVNPQSVIRRYQIKFEKSTTGWVFIFSKDGKIIAANHMQ